MNRAFSHLLGSLLLATLEGGSGSAAAAAASDKEAAGESAGPQYYIQEYRVQGAATIPALAVEEAVYPYLGRGRRAEDIEEARAALEQAYHARGFQAVAVEVPPQEVAEGVVFLKVLENPVGRLRVRGAHYFSPSAIRQRAPELAEGTVLQFSEVQKAVLRLNRQRDLRITPELKAGTTPGTLDVDLKVEDSLPVHGSIELNNRSSPDTTALRLNGSISYDNLWQAGHSAGFSFQVAPEKLSDASVYSAFYLARFKEIDGLSLLLQGSKQDSDVSTLGGLAVAGRGEVIGARLLVTLPGTDKFLHSLSAGVDYKHFKESILLAGQQSGAPIAYYPLAVNYGAAWTGPGQHTDLNLGINFSLRGLGGDRAEFDAKRYQATGNYFFLRGDLSHTQDLPGNFELFAKIQGQASRDSLISSEQYSGGGIGTVRGYLESTALGDHALLGSVELRSPSLLAAGEKKANEWRIYGFMDGGQLALNQPLPEQLDTFTLFSLGAGTRVKLRQHLNGSLDAGFPLRRSGAIQRGDWRIGFRVWAEF